MRKPTIPTQIFSERRRRLAQLIPGSAVILPSHPEQIRNHDVHQAYRQDSNLFYLTGFEEPESVLVFRPGRKPETVMFVRLRDVERETWDGFRYGPEGVVRNFGIEAAYPIAQFSEMAPDLLAEVEQVYYTLFQNHEFDEKFEHVLMATKEKRRRSGRGLLPVHDAYPLLGEMRVRKAEYDAEVLRRACQVTAEAHLEVMRNTKPGLSERALHGRFIFEIMSRGAAREGYNGIFASGAGATTLHYVFNDQTLKAGDLLLVDAGAEVDYFTGDITRTFPVSGKFTLVQRRLYEKVLEVQKHLVKMARPGVAYTALQDAAVDGLMDIMFSERLLKGSPTEAKERLTYKKYYPHGVSHYLGMDVHDAGTLEVGGQPRLLEPGMACTIEPGIYIPLDDASAPEELRGIGIRIEDDILLTADGADVLTSAAPKEVAELEAIVGSSA